MKAASVFLLLPVRISQGFPNPFLRSRHYFDTYTTTIRHNSVVCSSTMAPNGDKDSSTGFFLLKSEPCEFSIQDLEKQHGVEEWDGVRNYQARNIMRSMKVGDRAFFYHSSCKDAGIVGAVRIAREAQPDVTAWDKKHSGYDPKCTADECRWDSVQVRLDTVYPVTVTLKELKAQAKHNSVLADMTLLKNSRLSVHRLTAEEWSAVENLVDRKTAGEELGVKT